MTYRVRNIAVALVLAVLAALLTVAYVTSYKRDVQSSEADVSVLVAARDIPAGTAADDLVADGVLQRRRVERRHVVPGAIASAEQIEKLVATQAIYAGEQVTARRFAPITQQGVRAELRGNMRALQVPGTANQLLAGTLKAGDRIDVLASIRYKVEDVARGTSEAGDGERIATRVVLRDLEVLRASAASAASKLASGPGQSHSVVLAVTDTQAQKLFFVMKNGEWALQLRPVVDAADSPDSVETVQSVLGDGLRARQYRQLYAGKDVE